MPDIKHLFTIKSPADTVFAAISRMEGLKAWWTGEVSGEEKQGGTLRFGFEKEHFYKMKVISLKKDVRVAWQCADGPPDWIGTRLSFDLSMDKDKNTLVKFSQDGWKEANDFYANCNYQWGHFMRSLKQYCETGKGTPYIS